MLFGSRPRTVQVPEDCLNCKVGDNLIIQVSQVSPACTVVPGNLWVFVQQGSKYKKGIQVPVGRLADGLRKIIDEEFKRQDKKRTKK